MIMIWVALSSYILQDTSLMFDFKNLSLALLAFSLPIIFWLPLRNNYFASYQVESLERTIYRFAKNEKIFQKMLEHQPAVEISHFGGDIHSGDLSAPIQVTLVANPKCTPCAFAHSILEEIARDNDQVNVTYRFLINDLDMETAAYKALKTFYYLKLHQSDGSAIESISAWFESFLLSKTQEWVEKYISITSNEEPEVTRLVNDTILWCSHIGISKTPTILINGKYMPDEYSVADLKYHLRKMSNAETVNSFLEEI